MSPSDLFTVMIDGSGLTNVLGQTPDGEDGAQLSPDGRRVLVERSSAEEGENDIALLEWDGTEASEIAAGSAPVWQPLL